MKTMTLVLWTAVMFGCYENDENEAIDCERLCDADSACMEYADPTAAYADCLAACDGYAAQAAGVPEREADLACLDGCVTEDALAGDDAACAAQADCNDTCWPWFWFGSCSAHCRLLEVCGATDNVDQCQLDCSQFDTDVQSCLAACDYNLDGDTDNCGNLVACSAACEG